MCICSSLYVVRIQSALDGMLKALDHQVGKSFLSTNPQNMSRPEEEVLGYVHVGALITVHTTIACTRMYCVHDCCTITHYM